jgi:hypothetical protein
VVPVASAQQMVVVEVLKEIERERASAHPTPSPRQPAPKSVVAKGAPAQSARYHHPKERFPDDIAGQYLIGDFVIMGEFEDGGMEICAAEDANSMFPRAVRSFIIRNMSTGMEADHYYEDDQQPKISFTKSHPLRFVSKLYPARYSVEAVR